jgi:hypothetical protein
MTYLYEASAFNVQCDMVEGVAGRERGVAVFKEGLSYKIITGDE